MILEENVANMQAILQKVKNESFYWQIGLAALILLCIGHFLFIFLFWYLQIYDLVALNMLSVALYAYAILGLGIHTIDTKDDRLIGWIVYGELIVHAVVATRYIGIESGFQYYIYSLGMLPFFTFSYPRYIQVLRIVFSIFVAISIELSRGYFVPLVMLDQVTLLWMHTINLFIFLSSMSMISFFYTQYTKQFQATLLKQNTKDPLTDLFNRRYLISSVEKGIAEYKIHNNAFSLLLLDIDYFKRINDAHGHVCGDDILISISTLLTVNLHPPSVVSRWGGEEFLIFLPDTDASELSRIAERLRGLIEKHLIHCDNEEIKVTMTLGGSTYQPNESFRTLLNRADAALYEGKENGRNQVCIR